jgi:hypothetical protein
MSPIIDVSSHSIPFRARFAPVPYIQKGENVGVSAIATLQANKKRSDEES